jgi:hypothetical protein
MKRSRRRCRCWAVAKDEAAPLTTCGTSVAPGAQQGRRTSDVEPCFCRQRWQSHRCRSTVASCAEFGAVVAALSMTGMGRSDQKWRHSSPPGPPCWSRSDVSARIHCIFSKTRRCMDIECVAQLNNVIEARPAVLRLPSDRPGKRRHKERLAKTRPFFVSVQAAASSGSPGAAMGERSCSRRILDGGSTSAIYAC